MPVALHMARLRLVCVLASTATLSEAGLSSTMSSMFGSDATEAEAKAQTAYTSIKAESIVAAEAGICVCNGTGLHCVDNTCQNKDGGMMGELEGLWTATGPLPFTPRRDWPVPNGWTPWIICGFMWAVPACVAFGAVKVVRRLLSVTEQPQEEPFLHQGIE
mmetsp:Transcript_3294/g.10087  ORF Transcript_3294/g.10087 Transcript_3294/m.10087 type:complete len:161 (+) Transcript_3294:66-548(+)|eukprot:CAMPEP_0177364374 /NCGR_PEP_ID=MMETSP0368-20130122/38747_1 /TAXON_ID=447022 ORGANISM="Scrippsiella hangoei-like, Strain SHHI-4" /NCGR_SAMPLE_ID=MMETSP0368 /ASSEMBLY_ACC=CAM_ASM_000363 /LENGTH=160 /DNA_ID=CAMNT_0018827213 /DNA_START=62 /DNA_END=544 /DNA_ORIENTATION=+